MVFDLSRFNGDINPSNVYRQKLFLRAIEERKDDTKLKIDQINVKLIMTTFESEARKFGWGSFVNIILFDDLGGVHSILRNFAEVELDEVKKQESTTWGDTTIGFDQYLPDNIVCEEIDPTGTLAYVPRLYRCVRAGIIAKRITKLP